MSGFVARPEPEGEPEPEPENREPRQEPEGELRSVRSLDCEAPVICCCFSQTGRLLAVGLVNGNIKLYKPDTGAFVYYLRDSETLKCNLPVTSLNFCSPGTATGDLLLATYASGRVKLWHVSTQKCLQTLLENQETLVAAFNPSGTRFATGGTEGSVRLYDTVTQECLLTLMPSPSPMVMDGHRSRIFAVKFHPGRFSELISGGWDDTVQFWTENHPHSIRRIFGPHLCGDALQIHPKTSEILTGSWRRENSLEVWDYQTGQKLQDIPEDDAGHSLIYSCHWLGSDHLIGAGTRNNLCRLVNRNSMTTVGRLGKLLDGVYSTDVTPADSGRWLLAACSANHTHLLQHQEVGV
ncbi:WD repeat-containing protein 5B-like [Scyliorhinus canicula]|uniref:WD repeat-containing protein 5B-like n=1 Tax=Scyliorhinus canicula TaxID=7830 RepID=UPI0018F4209E|nr:WD repeat-containing protein 5B-like [Scyliorhinus canicula]